MRPRSRDHAPPRDASPGRGPLRRARHSRRLIHPLSVADRRLRDTRPTQPAAPARQGRASGCSSRNSSSSPTGRATKRRCRCAAPTRNSSTVRRPDEPSAGQMRPRGIDLANEWTADLAAGCHLRSADHLRPELSGRRRHAARRASDWHLRSPQRQFRACHLHDRRQRRSHDLRGCHLRRRAGRPGRPHEYGIRRAAPGRLRSDGIAHAVRRGRDLAPRATTARSTTAA